MRAQRLAVRRSAQTLTQNEVIVNSWRGGVGKALSHRYDRLLVLSDAHGVPPLLDYEAVLHRVPHRKRVGCAIGVRPAGTLRSADWSAKITSAGLNVVGYAVAGGLDEARMVGGIELVVQAVRALHRDPKIDAVLLVGPTMPIEPLARMIRLADKTLIIADLASRLSQWERLADGALAIDDYLAAEAP